MFSQKVPVKSGRHLQLMFELTIEQVPPFSHIEILVGHGCMTGNAVVGCVVGGAAVGAAVVAGISQNRPMKFVGHLHVSVPPFTIRQMPPFWQMVMLGGHDWIGGTVVGAVLAIDALVGGARVVVGTSQRCPWY